MQTSDYQQFLKKIICFVLILPILILKYTAVLALFKTNYSHLQIYFRFFAPARWLFLWCESESAQPLFRRFFTKCFEKQPLDS